MVRTLSDKRALLTPYGVNNIAAIRTSRPDKPDVRWYTDCRIAASIWAGRVNLLLGET